MKSAATAGRRPGVPANAPSQALPNALRAGLLLLTIGALAIVPVQAGAYWTGVGIELMRWVALTQSWVLLSGLTGYVSLGHAAFYGIGGYVTILLWPVTGLWLALPVAALAAGAVALVSGAPSLRVRGPYFVILTFGIAEFLKFAVIARENAIGAFGRMVMGGPDLASLYHLLLALAVAASLATLAVTRSRFGAGLAAIREDETAAETIGVPTRRLKLIAYTLSALVPGMVGGAMALRSGFFDVSQAFDPVVSFTIVTMAILGGAASMWGPILGALFLVTLHTLLWSSWPQLYMVILGSLLVGFVLFVPGGLTSLGRRRAPPPHPPRPAPAPPPQAPA